MRLLDCLGGGRRREVQLGPILRSINSRSCPAAMAQRGFDAIASEAYCQVSDMRRPSQRPLTSCS
eukprot:COSAG01_NODE_14650_length_1426_cov_2.116805_2_plen_64_part_01